MARPKKKNSNPQQSMEELLVNTVALYSIPYDDRDGERDSELPSLRTVADQLGTTVLRVRKLLIAAEYFSTATSRQVQQMVAEGNSVESVMRVTGLKRASVYSYLPYVGLAFNLEWTTVNADRHRLFRKRLKAVEALAEYAGTRVVTKCSETTCEANRLQQKGLQDIAICKGKDDVFSSNVGLADETDTGMGGETEYLCKEDADARYGALLDRTECHSYAGVSAATDCMSKTRMQDEMECLWKAVLAFESYPFRTAGRGKTTGVKFSYQVKRRKDGFPVGEIKVSRKEKTITRATIELAYRRAKAMGGQVTGPKKLGVFGASYLYPMLVRFGVIKG